MNNDKLPENPYFDFEETIREWRKYKYNPSMLFDRITEHDWVIKLKDAGQDGADKLYQVEFHEGEIIEEGTYFDEKHLGNIDVATAILFEFMKWGIPEIENLKMTVKALTDTQLNGMTAMPFYANFVGNLNGIKIIKGYYNREAGEVSNG